MCVCVCVRNRECEREVVNSPVHTLDCTIVTVCLNFVTGSEKIHVFYNIYEYEKSVIFQVIRILFINISACTLT